jgi:hypothetical protein
VVALALIVGVVGAVNRGLKGKPDWSDLQREAAHVWEHGHTAPDTAMFGYLPTTTMALWPFAAWLPGPWGVLAFIASNVGAVVLTVWIVYRWWLGAARFAAVPVWPLALVSVNFAHALQANQLTLWMLVLCVGGLTLVARGRSAAGGFCLGLATLIKVVPAILAVYLLLRRQWRAAAVMIVTVIVLDVLPCLAFFGWPGTVAEHRAWVQRAGRYSNWQWIEQPLLRVHKRANESLAVVLARWLRESPAARWQVILLGDPPPEVVEHYRAALADDEFLAFDPTPPREGSWAERRVDISWVPRMHVADLPAEVVWWIWAIPLAGGLGALAWFTWRGGGGGMSADWPFASALWLLAMFWPSPMLRHYYLAWAFPALVVVWQSLATARRGGGQWHAGEICGLMALIGWLIGVFCLGSMPLRWYGIHLVVLALLTAATSWAWYRTRRDAADASG